MMIVLLLLALTLSLTSCDVTAPIGNHWAGGFQGEACFTITEELTKWSVKLTFDQPISTLEAFTATVQGSNADKTEWTLVNKAYNGVEHVGDKLCLGFIGHGSGDIQPLVIGSMEGIAGGGYFSSGTTRIPLTHATQASQTQGSKDTLPPGQSTTAPPTVSLPTGVDGGVVSSLTISQDWGARFQAEFNFAVKEDIEGWVANVTFSKPVTQMDITIGTPYSHTDDGLNWVIINKKDRPFYSAGDTVTMRFFGNYQGSGPAPDGVAVLYNMGVDRGFNCDCPPQKTSTKYDYDCAIRDSIKFYAIQRSGKLPANNSVGWRSDSAVDDHGDKGEDLSGGWYDAGDHVKFNFPMAYSTVVLNWGFLEFRDAYDAAGLSSLLLDSVNWPLTYLLKCHVADDELYVQVGDGSSDHSYWGRPEEMTMARPAYKIDASKPGCDVAMETAAAFASGAMVFNETNPSYSATLLSHAKTLWQFAVDHKGKYSDSVSAAKAFYPSFNFTDEMCWGSMWLYKATGDQKYLAEAKKWFDPAPDWGMSWDDKVVACQLLLFEATGESQYKDAVVGTFTDWLPGGDITYTPKGLAWRLQWAPLRYASNMAMMALMAAKDGINAAAYRHWAMCQLHYSLGDTGFSYVVGYGDQGYPTRAHHRGGSCPIAPAPCGPQIMSSNAPNVHTLCGALVGGPGSGDEYKDERSNYVSNEVACDYNAGFQTAMAGLAHLVIAKQHPEQTGDATCPYS